MVRTGNAERLAKAFIGVSPLGAESARNRCFFWPPAMSNASLRISASIVFLPSKRWASRSWICKARVVRSRDNLFFGPAAVKAP